MTGREDIIAKLVNALLLASVKKSARRVHVRADRNAMTVHFTIGGERVEEMRPPLKLRNEIFDRILELGDLARPRLGETALGHFQIATDTQRYFFSVRVFDEDGARVAEIAQITADQYPHNN